ncbi:MAG: LacI family transcriptional regulator [Armatimonadetes bacterium]|nr:LacI family transcriptional regulator [Armatimonadota bacterium]
MGERTFRKPTLRDVAQRAYCSVSAASNILHGRTNLYSEVLVQRVLQAAQELGYYSPRLPRTPVAQRTYTLALVLERHHPSPTRNPFNYHVLDGILSTLEPLGYSLTITTTTALNEATMWERLCESNAEGVLLLAPEIGSPLLEWRWRCAKPAVVVGSTLPPSYGLPCVDVDNDASMRELTRWVIEEGHRAIGYVGGHPRYWSAQQRERAFREVLAEHGVPVREEWVFEGRYQLESGRDAARQLLQLAERPTAVLCANDLTAIGLLQELQHRGIRVPQDISVAGFDDIPAIHSFSPSLTTIHSPMAEMGREAVKLLLRMIEHSEPAPTEPILLSGTLVVRGSVRRCETPN